MFKIYNSVSLASYQITRNESKFELNMDKLRRENFATPCPSQILKRKSNVESQLA